VVNKLRTVNAYPDQVGRLLSAVGPLSEGEGYFVPAMACNSYTRQGNFIPQAEHITISNLRETVMVLAGPNTQPQIRESFYQHNPIQGAKSQ
jgi:hypothetical protein